MTWFVYGVAGVYFICQTHLFIVSIAQFLLLINCIKRKKPDTNQPLTILPFVTIQLPIYNEKYVVTDLIDCITKMNYPSDRFEIQILDDSTDETSDIVKLKLAHLNSNIPIYHIQRNERTGFKAGALKNGLTSAKGEFVAIFDADFRPHADFLQLTLPHFQNAEIGMVQTRCGYNNRAQTLITKTLAFGTDLYYTIEQSGRYNAGVFFLFNGTGGIWRTKCINEAGNWESDTLAEDMDLSYRAQLKGWKFKYIETPKTNGELAPLVAAVRVQQYRWIKGCMECGLKILPFIWKHPLSFYQKFHAYIQLTNSFAFLSIFICSILSLPMMVVKNVYHITFAPEAVFAFGSIVLLMQVFVSVIKSKDYYQKANLLSEALFYMPLSLIIYGGLYNENAKAAMHGLMRKKTSFVRTPKLGTNLTNNDYVKKPTIRFDYLFEVLMLLYFSLGVALAIYLHNSEFLVFHICLIIGYSVILYHTATEKK